MSNILLITGIFGFILTSILFLKKSTYTKATIFLGSFYLLLSCYTTHAYFLDGGHFTISPYFFLWPLMPFNLIAVPIYFYFTSIIEDEFKWKNSYLLLFIPFILSVIDVGYIYLQPADVFTTIYLEAINNPRERLHVSYLLLDGDQHLLIRHVWHLIALLLVFPKLRKFIWEDKKNSLKKLLNKWLLVFWCTLTLFALLAMLYALENMMRSSVLELLFHYKNSKALIPLILYLIIFSIGVIPIYFPSILYGYPRIKKQPVKIEKTINPSSEQKFGLEEAKIKSKLENLQQERGYLEKDFNVTKCARELEIPAHHLSYFIKKYYGISFTAYKNKLRMEHAKKLIEIGFLETNTIEALAWECGFASRSSFSKAFKSEMDLSPSEYALKFEADSL
ncbi:MAG: helix-turn-helix transcriptional regulator [Arenibacter latericius]|nr:helix-turn-helix transcriptional regulator [Arenibacter latericius]